MAVSATRVPAVDQPLRRAGADTAGIPDYQQDLIIGASLQVAPTGAVRLEQIVNIGTNRWSFKPEVGVSKAIGPWTLEMQAAATFFTDNNDFFGGSTRSQDPMYSLQGHVIYSFTLGHLVFARRDLLRRRPHEHRRRLQQRPAAELALWGDTGNPSGTANSVKLYASSGVSARTGNNFDLDRRGVAVPLGRRAVTRSHAPAAVDANRKIGAGGSSRELF